MSDEGEQLLTPRERQALALNPSAAIVQPQIDPAARPDLVGVGGWLGFLAISLTFLGPLFTLGSTASELSMLAREFPNAVGSSEMQTAITASWAIATSYCVISIFAGYRLFKHHVPSTVPIVICCLWVAGPLLGLVVLAMSDGDSQVSVDVVRSIIGVGIWTAYLLRSKRVTNTYRTPAPDPALADTFR